MRNDVRTTIDIQGRQLLEDLIVFEISDFDIILGMGFIGRNRAKIDYQRKKV